MNIPTITTDRLVLRPLTEEDLEPLHHVMSEKDIMQYFPNPDRPSPDRIQGIITHQLKHWEEHGCGWWALELRSKTGLIGWSGLEFLPETEETEVAYLLGKAFWGKGLATEAAQAGLRYGFEHVGLESIVGLVHPENIASQRVLEKLGMSFIDQARYFGMDCYHYSITVSSFRSGPIRPLSR